MKQQDPSNYRSAIWCRLLDLMKIYWRLDIAGSGCFTVAVGFATVPLASPCNAVITEMTQVFLSWQPTCRAASKGIKTRYSLYGYAKGLARNYLASTDS